MTKTNPTNNPTIYAYNRDLDQYDKPVEIGPWEAAFIRGDREAMEAIKRGDWAAVQEIDRRRAADFEAKMAAITLKYSQPVLIDPKTGRPPEIDPFGPEDGLENEREIDPVLRDYLDEQQMYENLRRGG